MGWGSSIRGLGSRVYRVRGFGKDQGSSEGCFSRGRFRV